MVPRVVAELVAKGKLTTVGAVLQRVALEADEEAVACILVGGGTGAVGQECAVLLGGLEPEHQCVVLLVIALEEVGLQR